MSHKIERTQYNDVTAQLQVPSKEHLKVNYIKIGFESLKFGCWFRKCTFYKIKTTGVPEYLFDLILETIKYTCSSKNVNFYSGTDSYRYSFFPYAILEWNKLDKNIQQSKTIMSFRDSLLKIGWPTPKPAYT